MSGITQKVGWFLFAFFAIGVGLYPLLYLLMDMSGGLLASKPAEVLQSPVWSLAFYLHIAGGGIALICGWPQFVKNWRAKNLSLHRLLGRIYVIAVFASGLAGLYIAFFATGGRAAVLGFLFLAIAWLITTLMAYITIKKKAIEHHQAWMIRSFALTFAAVTLRLWLPLMDIGLDMKFSIAYPIVAWLCWVQSLLRLRLHCWFPIFRAQRASPYCFSRSKCFGTSDYTCQNGELLSSANPTSY